MDAAKKQVETMIDNLLPDQQVALIAFDSTARRLTDFTDNKRILKEALAKLEVSPVRSHTIDALRMSQALSRTVPIERVLLVSDGNVPTDADFELAVRARLRAGSPRRPEHGDHLLQRPPRERPSNGRSSSASKARRTAPRRPASSSCFATASSVGTEPRAARPRPHQAGRLSPRDRRGGQPGSAADARRLRFAVPDNVAYLQIPKSRPLSVYVPSELTAFRRALRVQKGIELADETKARFRHRRSTSSSAIGRRT